MTKLKRQIIAVAGAAALLLQTAAPALGSTTIVVGGNASDTKNTANVTMTSNATVVQDNKAKVTNNVTVNSQTGKNTANENNLGDVKVDTGNSNVDAKVTNTLNKNVAHVDCCPKGDTEVLIEKNGSKSDNTVSLKQDDDTEIHQNNYAGVDNKVRVDAGTGNNEANKNNGGSVRVGTGDSAVKVTESTHANENWARIGGKNDDKGGKLSARIVNNASDTKNNINLTLDRDALIVQDNRADVDNDAHVKSETGNNEANKNNGGKVAIDTGDSTVEVWLTTDVNFNKAALDCGCLLDVLAKVDGNAVNSKNEIRATLDDDRAVFQGGRKGGGNDADVDNRADVKGHTGDNDASKNNAGSGSKGDPSVETGDSKVKVDEKTSGNENIFGDFKWPDMRMDGMDLRITLDLRSFLDRFLH